MDRRSRRVWKWSALGLALVVGASAAVGTVAVGASAPEVAATAKVKPCSLLTVEELQTVFGAPFATPEPLVPDPNAIRAGIPQAPACTFGTVDEFSSPGSPPTGSIFLAVAQGKKAKAAFKFELAARTSAGGPAPQRVEGFGGKANYFSEFEREDRLIVHPGILILRKKTFLKIDGSIHGYPDTPQFVDLATLEELATMALDRL